MTVCAYVDCGAVPNVAVTVVPVDSVNVHVRLVVHVPALLQPVKLEPDAGAAVSVTLPFGMLAVHVGPQLMPAGEEVTVPVPAPALLTVSDEVGTGLNAASTVVSALSVNVHVTAEPHPAPVHPANTEPAAAAAVSVTLPLVIAAVQVEPQLMPAGLEVTVPPPVPDLVTVTFDVGAGSNAALTLVFAFNVNVHTGLVVHEPALVHPAKVEPVAGPAVNVMLLPAGNDAEQVAPQLIAAGLDVTEPLPAPLREMLSCAWDPDELVPTLKWFSTCCAVSATGYTAGSSMTPEKYSCELHDPMVKAVELVVIAPVSAAEVTRAPLM